MYEFTRKEVVNFLNTFCLKVTKEDDNYLNIIDPDGVEYVINQNSVVYKFNSLKDDTASMIDTKILTHVIKSMDEFAEYWKARESFVEIEYTSENNKSVGRVKLHLR